MRVVVVGASGNVGTSVLRALAEEQSVGSMLAVSRRRPQASFAKTDWALADVSRSPLEPLFEGADAVVHLAWLIQPGRDEHTLHETNVVGSRRVFAAAANAGVKALVYASSVGAYSRGPKDRQVDETWPTEGIETSIYSRHKARVERILDRFEYDHPDVRVVRLRPGLIFKREAATEIRRLFVGPLVPRSLLREGLIPFVPDVPRLRFQAVHSLDAGDAYRRAVVRDVSGAFNIAAEPVLDPQLLSRLLGARRVPVPAGVIRGAADAAYRLRLQPSEPGWVDMALAVPLMDTTRARTQLGFEPRRTASDSLLELIGGMREGAGQDTPPLAPETSGPLRLRELLTGVGARQGVGA